MRARTNHHYRASATARHAMNNEFRDVTSVTGLFELLRESSSFRKYWECITSSVFSFALVWANRRYKKWKIDQKVGGKSMPHWQATMSCLEGFMIGSMGCVCWKHFLIMKTIFIDRICQKWSQWSSVCGQMTMRIMPAGITLLLKGRVMLSESTNSQISRKS